MDKGKNIIKPTKYILTTIFQNVKFCPYKSWKKFQKINIIIKKMFLVPIAFILILANAFNAEDPTEPTTTLVQVQTVKQ